MESRINRRPFTFDRVVRILFSVCIFVIALWLLHILEGVLLPFLVACLIAYILEPVVEWNMKLFHTSKRFIPVVLTLIETVGVIYLFCMIFIPYLMNEMSQMLDIIKKYATSQIDIPFISRNIHDFIRHNVDFNKIASYFTRQEWIEIVKKSLSSSWSFLSSGIGFVLGVLSWLIVILYVLFIMLDYERLMLSFKQLVPHTHRKSVFKVFSDVKNSMNRYFRGQFLISFIVGILFCVGFLIIKLPLAVVFGLFIGMLNMVPYLQLISLPIAAILCIVASVSTGVGFWLIFWECMAVYIIVQAIQDLILTPRIMGKVMGLNPAIILLSLSVWGCLLGFIGLIIALPLTTLILSYYDQYIVKRSNDKKESNLILPDDYRKKS
jgi:predicted PurR-regulated permease PerM